MGAATSSASLDDPFMAALGRLTGAEALAPEDAAWRTLLDSSRKLHVADPAAVHASTRKAVASLRECAQ